MDIYLWNPVLGGSGSGCLFRCAGHHCSDTLTKVSPGRQREQFSADRIRDTCQSFLHFTYLAGIQEKNQFSGVCFRKQQNFVCIKKKSLVATNVD